MRYFFVATFVVVALAPTSCRADGTDIRTVALSGDHAPGTTTQFSTFNIVVDYPAHQFASSPRINNLGQTVVQARLASDEPIYFQDEGIWVEQNEQLSFVAKEGDPPPDGIGVLDKFYIADLNDRSEVIFNGYTTSAFHSPGFGMWIWRDGHTETVSRDGYTEDGRLPSDYGFGFRPEINNSGEVFYQSGDFIGQRWQIWSTRSGQPAPLVRSGDPAPGVDGGFGLIFDPQVNDHGDFAFAALFGGDSGPGYGFWAETRGLVRMIAATGLAAPGTNAVFASFPNHSYSETPVINSAGGVAFVGKLTGDTTRFAANSGIWYGKPGEVSLVAREGDAAPGVDGVFGQFLSSPSPAINDRGDVAFFSKIIGNAVGSSYEEGIWSSVDGSLSLVAASGQPAPGTTSDFIRLYEPAITANGQTVFSAKIEGPGIDVHNDDGIWAQDPIGNLVMIMREGGEIDVDDGPGVDFRTVEGFGFEVDGVNRRGQIAFTAVFTDGSSGVFVSNVVAIPEPGGRVLAVLATLLFATVSGYRVVEPVAHQALR